MEAQQQAPVPHGARARTCEEAALEAAGLILWLSATLLDGGIFSCRLLLRLSLAVEMDIWSIQSTDATF